VCGVCCPSSCGLFVSLAIRPHHHDQDHRDSSTPVEYILFCVARRREDKFDSQNQEQYHEVCYQYNVRADLH
jgi:hypothetical protein